ncbi:MAG: alpha-L-fucosidase [Verrucomicrobiota bacterium]
MRIKWMDDELVKLSMNFHWHSFMEVSSQYDENKFLENLKKTGVKTVTIEAKCGIGYTYYPSKYGLPHPQLKSDYFGDRLKLLKANGFRVIAYFSLGMDGINSIGHDDYVKSWCTKKKHELDSIVMLNLNSAIYDEVILPQMKEVLEGYEIDAFWMDIFSNDPYWGTNEDEYTRKLYYEWLKSTPCEIDKETSYAQFQISYTEVLRKKIADDLAEYRKTVPFALNSSYRYARKEGIVTDYLSRDAVETHCGNPLEGSYVSRFFASTGYSSYIDIPVCNDWGKWNYKNSDVLLREALCILTGGSTVNIYDPLYSTGMYDDDRCNRISGVLSEIRQREPWLKAAKPDPEVYLLACSQSDELNSANFLADSDGSQTDMVDQLNLSFVVQAHQVAANVLATEGYNYGACSELGLAQVCSNASTKVIICPYTPVISDETFRELKAFVERGGILVLAGEIDPKLQQLCGIQPLSVSGAKMCYMRVEAPLLNGEITDQLPVPVMAKRISCEIDQGTVLARTGPVQYEEHHDENYIWGYPEPSYSYDSVGILKTECGKGSVLYYGFHLFEAYGKSPSHDLSCVLKESLKVCGFTSEFTNKDNLHLELSKWGNGQKSWLHIVNMTNLYEKLDNATSNKMNPARRVSKLRSVRIHAKSVVPEKVILQPEGHACKIQAGDESGEWYVEIPELHVHQILELHCS